jgi:hypothetical protein
MTTLQGLIEERVFWDERFQGREMDFRGKSALTRFDCCTFVKCTIHIDDNTEHLAFTECVFQDCNIDRLPNDDARALFAQNNVFDQPLDQRRADFAARLNKALAARSRKA